MTPMGRGKLRDSRSERLLACAGVCMLAVLASSPAVADEVYGQVKVGGHPVRGGTLEFRRQGSPGGTVAVGIGEDGNYRVFLEPGRYEARLRGPGTTRPVGVSSLPAPIRQDLVFP